jgi:hypothetical protein
MRVCGGPGQKAPPAIVEDDTRADILHGDVQGRSVIEHGPPPRRWPPRMGNPPPLAHAVLAASKGLHYNPQLNDLDADPCHGTDAHGYGVSVSPIAVMVAGVARPVGDRRMAAGAAGLRVTISRTLLMPTRHALFTRHEDADACGRSCCPRPRGHTSPQLTRVAAILTTRVHPDRQGGTGTAADRSDVES